MEPNETSFMTRGHNGYTDIFAGQTRDMVHQPRTEKMLLSMDKKVEEL